jgi:hypothetical protein
MTEDFDSSLCMHADFDSNMTQPDAMEDYNESALAAHEHIDAVNVTLEQEYQYVCHSNSLFSPWTQLTGVYAAEPYHGPNMQDSQKHHTRFLLLSLCD